MNNNVCHHCGVKFTGRSNQKYCTTTCKSAVNNTRINERDKAVKIMEQRIRNNRKILSNLYNLFKNEEIPSIIIEKVSNQGFDQNYNNGMSVDKQTLRFLDYTLSKLSNKNFLIKKLS